MEERAGRESEQARREAKKEEDQSVARFFATRELGGTTATGHENWGAREHELMRA